MVRLKPKGNRVVLPAKCHPRGAEAAKTPGSKGVSTVPRPKKTAKSAPALKVHKSTGQAYVILDGRRTYLGKADHPDTETRYRSKREVILSYK